MIFNNDDVIVPERLLQALTSNQLVIFVGAGTSARAFKEQDENTFYPTFRQLAHKIGERLGRQISEQEIKFIKDGYIDQVLGVWEDQNTFVRQRTVELLEKNENGQRIELHRKILRLFAGKLTPRIVTTNFDRLLVRALEAEGLENNERWKIYKAPALPPANRFSGICCLHGTVDDPAEMVLTDKDIGRAYMDEGWALRFAHAMFQQFDVLFVGYSLDDPPLRYLSLALEGGIANARGRWALLNEPDDTAKKDAIERHWNRRHVEPIWFRATDEDYRSVERTLGDWATDSARSFLDKRAQLAEMSSDKPSNLRPHELSRAQYFLRDPACLRDFAKASLDSEWFGKLHEWQFLDFLLTNTGASTEADGILLERITGWIIENHIVMLGDLAKYRATLSVDFIDHFFRSVEDGRAAALNSFELVEILEFFRPKLEQATHLRFALINLKSLLERLLDEGQRDYAIWLYTQLLRTSNDVRVFPSFHREYLKLSGKDVTNIPESDLRFEFRFIDQLSDHESRVLFDSLLRPRISQIGSKLISALTHVLLQVRTFERPGVQHPSNDWRSAIEPHPQDRHRNDPIDSVLNLLRDSWEALLAVDPDSAKLAYNSWESIDDGLIERLRIHAMRRLLETCLE